jgi:hypothetical protein
MIGLPPRAKVALAESLATTVFVIYTDQTTRPNAMREKRLALSAFRAGRGFRRTFYEASGRFNGMEAVKGKSSKDEGLTWCANGFFSLTTFMSPTTPSNQSILLLLLLPSPCLSAPIVPVGKTAYPPHPPDESPATPRLKAWESCRAASSGRGEETISDMTAIPSSVRRWVGEREPCSR